VNATEPSPANGKARRSVGRPPTARSRGRAFLASSEDGQATSIVRESADCALINSLARGLQVLAAFGPDNLPLANKEIAARTGIPKATISRLTDTLLKLNFLAQDRGTGRYTLGAAALTLGLSARAQVDLASIARPHIERFALAHDVSVQLGARDGLEVRAVAIGAGASASGTRMALGACFPLDGTGLGYAHLAHPELAERDRIFAALADLRGEDWPAARLRIDRALREIATEGYFTSLGEWSGTLSGLAAPLTVPGAPQPLAISFLGSAQTFTARRLRAIAPAFVALLGEIEAAARQRPAWPA